MATQTGSIDLTASNSVKLAAEAGWQSDLEEYYTKSEIDVTVEGINSTVSTKVGEDEVISSINQSSESVSINASKINLTGAVTISDLDSSAQAATLNSNISVGGRNLLPTSLVNSNVQSGVTVSGITIVLEDDGWFRVSGSKSGDSAIGLWSDSDYTTPAVPQLDNVSGKTLTWTIETEGTPFVAGSTYDTSTHIVAYGTSSSNAHRFGGAFDLVRTVTPQVTHYGEIRYYIGENVPEGTTVNGRFRIMVEFGNVSTAWTYAPEDAVTFIDVGGRNLLRNTGNLAASGFALTRATVADGIITVTPTTSAGYAKFKVDYLDFDDFGSGEYTLSFDAKAVSGATYTQLKGPMCYAGFNVPSRIDESRFSSSYDRFKQFTLSPTLTSEWAHYSHTFTVPDDFTSGETAALTSGSNLTIAFAMTDSYAPMMVRNVKLEKGNKATDWSPAPEDIEAYADESAYLNAKPNLAPWFSNHPIVAGTNTASNPEYWYTGNLANADSVTYMGDGWMRIVIDNSEGSSAKRFDFVPAAAEGIACSESYTWLMEYRNNASSGSGSQGMAQTYVVQQGTPVSVQFWGNYVDEVISGGGTNTAVYLAGTNSNFAPGTRGIYEKRFVRTSEASDSMYYDRTGFKGLATITAYVKSGGKFDCEMRVSVYSGRYTGPYKPYSGADASNAAKTATNYITADSTGIKIHMSGNSTTYQHQSATATTYYVNGNKRTVVSADGLEVFDGTYGSEESVAAFGTVARLGKDTGNKVIVDSTGVHIYNVHNVQGLRVSQQVAEFGQAPGELTTTMLSDEPAIGTNYPVPSDAIEDIRIILDDQPLEEDTDYTLSSGIVTLLESTTVTSILDDSGSSGEEGSEDVDAHSLICEYTASAGVGLAIGASVTRPGLDVAERAIFRHPSFVEASHSTANADTGFRAVRNDTGIQVFCGIGIGGVNHGVYSQTLKRWLINADRSAVHVAPHTVTDGNINIKSKWVYATTPSASKGNGWGHGLQYLDTAGDLVGVVKAYSLTTGEKGIQLQATRNIGSTTYNNGIRFGVDTSGKLKLAFSGGGRLLWRQALGFDSGDVASSYGGSDNAPKNAYRDIPVTFNFTHTYVPHVVATFSSGSTGVTMGGLSLSVHSITYNGCQVRIYNNTNDTRNPALKWVAID